MIKIILLLLITSITYSQKNISVIQSQNNIILTQLSPFGEVKGIELTKKNKFTFMSTSSDLEFYYFLNTHSEKIYSFFVFPSDTIKIILAKNGLYLLKGKNQAEYDLLSALEKDTVGILFHNEGRPYSWIDSFEKSRQQARFCFRKRGQIIESYKSSIRPAYYELLKTLNWLTRLNHLLAPYNPCTPIPRFVPPTQHEAYFAEIDSLVAKLNQIEAKYLYAVSLWLSPILVNYSNYSVRHLQDNVFDHKFKEASNTFKGDLKDIYLTGLMLDKVNNEYVNVNYLDTYFFVCKNETYKNKVRQKHRSLYELSTSKVLQNTLLSCAESPDMKWGEIIKQQTGSIVYVDFWASWCAGCKQNLPHLASLKKRFPQLQIIFISIDTDPQRWRQALQSWGHASLGSHYRLDPQTQLATILAKPSIPRQSLIDKKGSFISIDAYPPNNSLLLQQLEDLLKQ